MELETVMCVIEKINDPELIYLVYLFARRILEKQEQV